VNASRPPSWTSGPHNEREPHRPYPCLSTCGAAPTLLGAARFVEGLDPDDPAVVAAMDLVRWEVATTG
jgi:hypothetical protein